MPPRIDVVGLRFGRLVVTGEAPAHGNRRRVFCRCDCGTVVDVEPRELRAGQESCGCLRRERVGAASAARVKHRGTGTKEYTAWTKIKARCGNPRDAKYAEYGGRGITVCEAWTSSFEAFLADMGPAPTRSHSIDRIDVNGHYEPANCRWATAKEQARNKRVHRLVELDGVMMPLSQACELAGVNYRTALYRLNRGQSWLPLPAPPEEAK